MVNADRDTYLEIIKLLTHTVYRARARTDREGYVRAVGPRRPVQTYFGQIILITDRERSAEPPTRALKLSTYHSHTQDRLDLGANNADATIRVVRSLGVGFGPLDREGTCLLSQRIVPRVGDWNASVSLYVQLRGQAPGAATPGN